MVRGFKISRKQQFCDMDCFRYSTTEYGQIWKNLEIAYEVFSLLIIVVQTLTLMNASDDTLSSLRVSKYSRWRIGCLPVGTIKTV